EKSKVFRSKSRWRARAKSRDCELLNPASPAERVIFRCATFVIESFRNSFVIGASTFVISHWFRLLNVQRARCAPSPVRAQVVLAKRFKLGYVRRVYDASDQVGPAPAARRRTPSARRMAAPVR